MNVTIGSPQSRRFRSELLVDLRCELGEGPCWLPDSQTLLWVDIDQGRIHRLPPTGSVETIGFERAVGAVVPRSSGGLVAVLDDGLAFLDDDGAIERHVEIEADLPAHRANDAKVDRQGRLWVGTLHREFLPGRGALYRVDPDGDVEPVLTELSLPNGLDWSNDGETMYLVDSVERRIDVFDFEGRTGQLSNRRPFLELPEEYGLPDGLTVAADDTVWVAYWGGAAVRAWDSGGTPVAKVEVPTPLVTSCAFGGASFERLLITTASGHDPSQPPPAGGVFVADVGARGRPADAFAG
jgi:sugar lactone lactonase YvrE